MAIVFEILKLIFQAAALAVSQHLTAEAGRTIPPSLEEDEETEPLKPADPNAMVAYIPPPALPQGAGARLQKPKKLKPLPPPPQPMVAQIIEMGFTRSKVEFAIKALGTKF